jgi:hypothetical protein
VRCRRAVLLGTRRALLLVAHTTHAGVAEGVHVLRARVLQLAPACARVEQACTHKARGFSQAACNVLGVVQRGVNVSVGTEHVGAVARALCTRATSPARDVRTPRSVRDGMCVGAISSCTACQACLD